MSDSDSSHAPKKVTLPDSSLESSLRQQVIKAQRAGQDIIVNAIRAASEEALGLQLGFFKNHDTWSSRSKHVIRDQNDIEPPPSPKSLPVSPPTKATNKRSSEERDVWPRKRKKIATKPAEESTSDELSSPPSAADSESYDERPAKIQKPKPKQKPKSQPQPQHKSAAKPVTLKKSKKPAAADSPSDDEMNSSSPSSEVNHPESLTAKTREVTQANSTATKNKAKPHPVKRSPVELEEEDNDEQTASKTLKLDDDSDSDLSSLLDEAPVSRKGQKAQKAKRPSHQSNSTKKTSSSKSQAKTDADIDPDQAEIKRLQGWLTKCGIRKMWYKELQPYDTARAKIKHLKEMLSEAGMTGRYSIEKANQIRDARELAADIEEVQAGAERWGKEGDTGQDRGRNSAEDEIKPGRRLIRGARNYDFLSSDGEETD